MIESLYRCLSFFRIGFVAPCPHGYFACCCSAISIHRVVTELRRERMPRKPKKVSPAASFARLRFTFFACCSEIDTAGGHGQPGLLIIYDWYEKSLKKYVRRAPIRPLAGSGKRSMVLRLQKWLACQAEICVMSLACRLLLR